MPRYPGHTFTQKVNYAQYIERNQRQLDEKVQGTFTQYVNASALNSGSPINYTHGLSKIFVVVNAGSDFAGTITLTGTTVDRETGVETGADTENITIDALTTDTSDTDAESNVRHAFSGAYITNKWFKGAVAISTADVTLTDVDVWGIAFEQIDDTPRLLLQTFNSSFTVTNTAAWFYAYLYTLVVTAATKKCTLARSTSLELSAADSETAAYRLRKGNLGVVLDGSKDGFWYGLFMGPNVQNYFDDIALDVWFDVTRNIN
jgi:hypothetical protein